MGRVKLKIKKLENTNGRQATYAKRKHGIMKKANELSILCDIDIVLLMFSPSGKPFLCCGRRSSIEEVIAKFAQVTPQERTKRKLESLGALKKAFKKLDHDVNIQEFIAKSDTTIEDLSNQARILQNRLSEIHGRLSYWTEPEKINSNEHLNQLENSIRQSLDQIHAHKENFGKQYIVQLQDTSLVKEWSNCSTHVGIQIPFEQQLQSFSWIPNNDGRNIVADEQSLIPNRDMECSASSSYGSYPGYFATGKSPEISFSEQEISFLDGLNATFQLKPQTNIQQFPYIPYDFDLLNDLKPQPLPPGLNIPMNHTDFHINRILEATGSAYDATQASWGSNSVPCPVSIFDEPLFSQMQQPN